MKIIDQMSEFKANILKDFLAQSGVISEKGLYTKVVSGNPVITDINVDENSGQLIVRISAKGVENRNMHILLDNGKLRVKFCDDEIEFYSNPEIVYWDYILNDNSLDVILEIAKD